MKRIKILLAGVCILFAASTYAQQTSTSESPARRGLSLSIGPEVAFPLGTFKDFYKLGLGGSAKLNIPVANNIDLSVSAGYMAFSSKGLGMIDSVTINKNSYSFIPFKAGVRFRTNGGFYIEPQAGYTQTKVQNMEGAGYFTYAGNVGYMVGRAIDLALRYEGVAATGESLKFIGFRVAYNIPFARVK